MGPSDARVLSRPCRVHFAGFETTTTRLQQAGWELSVYEDLRRLTMQLAMRFEPARLYMMSESVDFNYFSSRGECPEFFVRKVVGSEIVLHTTEVPRFHAIDAMPTFVNSERRSIEDFSFFATPLVRTEQIIVEPETVSDLLAKIKAMQAPELAAIRERNRRRDAGHVDHGVIEQQKFHAQIVSLAA